MARDVSHENTVRFVGACIDLPRPMILILTEYCPKGILNILCPCLHRDLVLRLTHPRLYCTHFREPERRVGERGDSTRLEFPNVFNP